MAPERITRRAAVQLALSWLALPLVASDEENAIRHVHDPCIIREGDWYYVFSTGPGILVRRSKDLIHWEFVGRAFAEDVPEWAQKEIPRSRGLWAPDIAHFNGRFHLYYSVSTFGSNRSIIGMASSKTLETKSPDYGWQDEGKVFESFRQDNYNAIDSNVVAVSRDRMALTFGSFWSGIKLIMIDPKTGKPPAGAEVVAIAQRPAPCAEEAPFLIRRDRYFYLFISFDLCCRGVNSTYNIRVGRAPAVEGPYIDRDGVSLREGGGTVLLATEGRYVGPGHCAVLKDGKRHLLVNHFYDRDANGTPTLQVRPLRWDRDGWPLADPPLE